MSIGTLDHDTEAALRGALARAAAPHGAPDALADRLAARSYRTRSTRPVVAAGLAGAAVLTGVGVLATGGGPPRATPPASAVHLTNAQLTAEVTQAVDGAAGDIFEVRMTGENQTGSSVHWVSPDGNTLRTASYDASGAPLIDETFVTSGAQQAITYVDYQTKTWWKTTVAAPVPPAACVQPTCFNAANGGFPPGGVIGTTPVSAAGVAWFLSTGGFTKTGQTKAVDGIPNAFEIARTTPVTSGVGFGDMDMWIDPATNLPVQVTVGDLGTTPLQSDITWLDPTTNAAQLQTTVPAGFTQVPADPTGE